MAFPAYFEQYGGVNSVIRSRFFWCAVVITTLMAAFFSSEKWWELAISVIPGLVSFSIAGVAIFVSLGSDALRAVIAGKKAGSSESSPFVGFMSMFTHFIVIQLLALLSALLAKAFYVTPPQGLEAIAVLLDGLKVPFWLLGGLLFNYAILLCIALAIEIYRLAEMIDEFQTVENEVAEAARKAGDARGH